MAQPNSTRLQGGKISRSCLGAHKGHGDIKTASMKISLSQGPQVRVSELFSAQVNGKNRCIN